MSCTGTDSHPGPRCLSRPPRSGHPLDVPRRRRAHCL